MSVQDVYNRRMASLGKMESHPNIGIRKNYTTLTPTEKNDFVTAIKTLKQNGIYDQFVRLHMAAMPDQGQSVAHKGPAFLPWHRRFLFELELHMADVLGQPDYGLPYWNWSVDVDHGLMNSTVWGADFLGGIGNPVPNGPFAGTSWPVNKIGNVAVLIRSGDDSHKPKGSVAVEYITDSLQIDGRLGHVNVSDYDSLPYDATSATGFRNLLEGQIHNPFHAWVGGQMDKNFSPDDPAFFLHHCFMDRLWARWQWENDLFGLIAGKPNYPDIRLPAGHNLREPLYWDSSKAWNGVNNIEGMAPISDTRPNLIDWLNHENLGYRYDDERNWSNTALIVAFPGYKSAVGSTNMNQAVTVTHLPQPQYTFVLRPGAVYLSSDHKAAMVLSSKTSKNVMIQYDPNLIPFNWTDPKGLFMTTDRYSSYQTGLYMTYIMVNQLGQSVNDIVYYSTVYVGQAGEVNRDTLMIQTFEIEKINNVQPDSFHPNVFGLKSVVYPDTSIFQDGSSLKYDKGSNDQQHAFSFVPFPIRPYLAETRPPLVPRTAQADLPGQRVEATVNLSAVQPIPTTKEKQKG